MNNKLIPIVLTLVVGIILAGSVLMPVINDATETERTFINDGYMRYSAIESTATDEITIEWDYTAPKSLTVGDETIDLSVLDKDTSIVFGDNWSVRYTTAGDLQYIGNLNADYLFVTATDEANLTITLNAGSATLVSGTTTKTNTYTTAYYPNNDGTMIMKKANESAYLLKDSSIISANGITNVPGGSVGIRFTGTINDGFDFTYYRNTAEYEEENVSANYSEISEYTDLVKLNNITFNLVSGDNDILATYSYFLIPYEVTAENSHPLSPGQIALMGAIPVMVIVALLVVAVGVVARRNE